MDLLRFSDVCRAVEVRAEVGWSNAICFIVGSAKPDCVGLPSGRAPGGGACRSVPGAFINGREALAALSTNRFRPGETTRRGREGALAGHEDDLRRLVAE
jgi:hypothetical protein